MLPQSLNVPVIYWQKLSTPSQDKSQPWCYLMLKSTPESKSCTSHEERMDHQPSSHRLPCLLPPCSLSTGERAALHLQGHLINVPNSFPGWLMTIASGGTGEFSGVAGGGMRYQKTPPHPGSLSMAPANVIAPWGLTEWAVSNFTSSANFSNSTLTEPPLVQHWGTLGYYLRAKRFSAQSGT